MPGNFQLILAPAAKEDLKQIYLYGKKHWGKAQTSDYLEKIKHQLWKLRKFPKSGQERKELQQGIRSIVCGSHLIFYRLGTNKIEVLRALHHRQDVRLNL